MLLNICALMLLLHAGDSTNLNSSIAGTSEGIVTSHLLSRLTDMVGGEKIRQGWTSKFVLQTTTFNDKNNKIYSSIARNENLGITQGPEISSDSVDTILSSEEPPYSERRKAIDYSSKSLDETRIFRRRLSAYRATTDWSEAARALYDYIVDEPTQTSRAENNSENEGLGDLDEALINQESADNNFSANIVSNTTVSANHLFLHGVNNTRSDREGTESAKNLSIIVVSTRRSEQNNRSESVENTSRKLNISMEPKQKSEALISDAEALFVEEYNEATKGTSRTTETRKSSVPHLDSFEDTKTATKFVLEEIRVPVSHWRKGALFIVNYRWPLFGLFLQIFVIMLFFVPRIRQFRKKR